MKIYLAGGISVMNVKGRERDAPKIQYLESVI